MTNTVADRWNGRRYGGNKIIKRDGKEERKKWDKGKKKNGKELIVKWNQWKCDVVKERLKRRKKEMRYKKDETWERINCEVKCE